MKRSLVAFVILVLIGAAINVPIALEATRRAPQGRGTVTVNVFGADAVARGWPDSPPKAWPAVTQWSEEIGPGYVIRQAWSAENRQTTHQMEFRQYGWPVPVLRHRRLWWPWDDPAWQTDVPPDSGLALNTAGLVLNPLLFGGVAWLILVAPILAWSILRRRMRVRAGRCPACGYPRGDAAQCTECGVALPSA